MYQIAKDSSDKFIDIPLTKHADYIVDYAKNYTLLFKEFESHFHYEFNMINDQSDEMEFAEKLPECPHINEADSMIEFYLIRKDKFCFII